MLAVPSTICGRQLAAPTQNVERHVAMKSTNGRINRRRGRDRKNESSSCGNGGRCGDADPIRAAKLTAGSALPPWEFPIECAIGDPAGTAAPAGAS